MDRFKLLSLLAGIFIFLASGCASAPPRQLFEPALPGSGDKAVVYVYCRAYFQHSLNVEFNGDVVVFANNTYYSYYVDPGRQVVVAKLFGKTKEVTLNVIPGKQYYVKVTTTHNPFRGFNIITQSDHSVEEIDFDNAAGELKLCSLARLMFGKVLSPKGYNTQGPVEKSENRATVHVYRRPVTLVTSGISKMVVGLYSGNGASMTGAALGHCEVLKYHAIPGEVKCVSGNVSFSDVGKAAFAVGGALTGIHPSLPGDEFLQMETGLADKRSLDFVAEPGKSYYLEHDFIGRFSFIDPKEIKTECLYSDPVIISKRNLSFKNDIVDRQKKICIAWAKDGTQNCPQYYGKVTTAGGVLDYLFVEAIKEIRDGDLKDRLKTEAIQPIVENRYLSFFDEKLRQRGIETLTIKQPFDLRSYTYSEVTSSTQAEYIYILEVLAFGIARNHSGILPVVFSGKPVAFASIKGIVIDKTTGAVLFRMPFNGFEVLSEDWDSSPDNSEWRIKLERALDNAVWSFLLEAS